MWKNKIYIVETDVLLPPQKKFVPFLATPQKVGKVLSPPFGSVPLKIEISRHSPSLKRGKSKSW